MRILLFERDGVSYGLLRHDYPSGPWWTNTAARDGEVSVIAGEWFDSATAAVARIDGELGAELQARVKALGL